MNIGLNGVIGFIVVGVLIAALIAIGNSGIKSTGIRFLDDLTKEELEKDPIVLENVEKATIATEKFKKIVETCLQHKSNQCRCEEFETLNLATMHLFVNNEDNTIQLLDDTSQRVIPPFNLPSDAYIDLASAVGKTASSTLPPIPSDSSKFKAIEIHPSQAFGSRVGSSDTTEIPFRTTNLVLIKRNDNYLTLTSRDGAKIDSEFAPRICEDLDKKQEEIEESYREYQQSIIDLVAACQESEDNQCLCNSLFVGGIGSNNVHIDNNKDTVSIFNENTEIVGEPLSFSSDLYIEARPKGGIRPLPEGQTQGIPLFKDDTITIFKERMTNFRAIGPEKEKTFEITNNKVAFVKIADNYLAVIDKASNPLQRTCQGLESEEQQSDEFIATLAYRDFSMRLKECFDSEESQCRCSTIDTSLFKGHTLTVDNEKNTLSLTHFEQEVADSFSFSETQYVEARDQINYALFDTPKRLDPENKLVKISENAVSHTRGDSTSENPVHFSSSNFGLYKVDENYVAIVGQNHALITNVCEGMEVEEGDEETELI